jgi:Flp pilus assembly CpaE family ATPase
MSSQATVRVLLIEDNPGDAELVKITLAENADSAFQVSIVEALLPALDHLGREEVDVVLLDLSLPDSRGLDGLSTIRRHMPSVPVVVLTGLDSESLAIRAVQSGAQDYLVKGSLLGPILGRTLQHAIIRQKTQLSSSAAEAGLADVVGLLGAKGGVGTTTVACYLARELSRETSGRVLLMDLDGAANQIAFLMGATGQYSIADACADLLRLDQERWAKLAIPAGPELDVIQSPGIICQEEQMLTAERVRFVIKFVRSFYRFIVIDMGRLNPFSARIAEDLSRLYLVSTAELPSLNEAKWTIHALSQSRSSAGSPRLILNLGSKPTAFGSGDLEKLLGVKVEAMLPEVRRDFSESYLDGKRLPESRAFQKQIAEFAGSVAGTQKETQVRKARLSFLSGNRSETRVG